MGFSKKKKNFKVNTNALLSTSRIDFLISRNYQTKFQKSKWIKLILVLWYFVNIK
jgi:hypothetical protein